MDGVGFWDRYIKRFRCAVEGFFVEDIVDGVRGVWEVGSGGMGGAEGVNPFVHARKNNGRVVEGVGDCFDVCVEPGGVVEWIGNGSGGVYRS